MLELIWVLIVLHVVLIILLGLLLSTARRVEDVVLRTSVVAHGTESDSRAIKVWLLKALQALPKKRKPRKSKDELAAASDELATSNAAVRQALSCPGPKSFRTSENYRDHLPCEVCEPKVKA